MQTPPAGHASATPQSVTFPNGTTFGGASGRQASELAQIIVDSNNNNMRDYQQLQGTESKNLQTSQQALQMIEQLSNQQGTGADHPLLPHRVARAQTRLGAGYSGSSTSSITSRARAGGAGCSSC